MQKITDEHLERIGREPPGDVEKILRAIQTIEPRHYICYRAIEPIVIDGHLNEASWKKAPWTELFVHIEDDWKIPPLATRAKMLWDDEYFYVAADLEDPDVWGVETRRDAPIPDPDFEVFIDPDGDALNYMEMEMNALNTVWDLFLEHPYHRWYPKQPDGWNPTAWNWDGIKTAVQVDGTLNAPWIRDRGWTVEIAFDMKSMAPHCIGATCPPKHGDQWRVNMSRVNRNREGTLTDSDWVWSRQGIYNMHIPEMYGIVQFSDKPVGTGYDTFIKKD
ncbi:MAG: hypothetical protein FJY97_10525 [candidate division Zixibacteria bacterium]|nr:hypothetical protein [candidate division Zixibacteria bacterium]